MLAFHAIPFGVTRLTVFVMVALALNAVIGSAASESGVLAYDRGAASVKAGNFVDGIAAFREARCGRTLREAFSKAANPERVWVGGVSYRL